MRAKAPQPGLTIALSQARRQRSRTLPPQSHPPATPTTPTSPPLAVSPKDAQWGAYVNAGQRMRKTWLGPKAIRPYEERLVRQGVWDWVLDLYDRSIAWPIIRRQTRSKSENIRQSCLRFHIWDLVEPRGIEPLTSTMPL